MSDIRPVNTALQEYFIKLSEQILAATHLKDTVTELLEKRDEATKSGKGNLDEWDVLDQSYICIKLRNAFAEIDTKLTEFKKNVSIACKQKDKHENYVKDTQSTSEEVLALILSIISELHKYHKTVAECIAPIVEYSAYRERYPSKYEMKECSGVPVTWKAVNEVNRTLRYGYGLSKEDLAAILSWMHGEDLSESARKHLNLKVDGLVLTYRERLSNLDSCEFDVPVAFQLYPLVLQDVIKDCCSPVESIAATGQALPTHKEDLETLIRREIPRVQLQIGDSVYDIASPGKAFENTKQKMVAVRHLVIKSAKWHKIEITKDQLDLFSLKVLATACISIANASARTAVLIAFGKANLIQVKPSNSKSDETALISINNGSVHIEVPSQWSLTEDNSLLQSLSRDSTWNSPIATVDTIYKSILNLKADIQRQAQSLPIVRIMRCSGISSQKGTDKKDPSSKGLRKRLSRATSKLFNRKSIHGLPPKDANRQDDVTIDGSKGKIEGIDNLGVSLTNAVKDGTCEDVTIGDSPVPPPRPRRKARKKRKSEAARKQLRLLEEAKHDPQWFSSCKKLEEPALPNVEASSASLSIASFEELKDVIDLLSGSSTSSLSLNQQIDAEKNPPQKTGSKKEKQFKKEIETKGKVSPSDSGIGSSMSVQSHPSISSIAKQHGIDSLVFKTSDVIVSEKINTTAGGLGQRSSISNLMNTSLEDTLIPGNEEGSRKEDAEVEMYTDTPPFNAEDADDQPDGRDDDETPSNGKNTDFVNIQAEYSSSSESEEESVVDIVDDQGSMINSKEDLAEITPDIDVLRISTEDQQGQLLNVPNHDHQIIPDHDHHSYDADGSDQSEDNNPIKPEEPVSKNLLHGSNDSLYYSAWTLNDVQPQHHDQSRPEDQPKPDDQPKSDVSRTEEAFTTDSYFASGLTDSSFSENADTSEDFQECREPDDEMLYQHFNPRFSWPVGLGDRLAAIWGEREMQLPQNLSAATTTTTTTTNEIWSAEESLPRDRRSESQKRQDAAVYMVRSQQTKTSSMVLSPANWLPPRRRTDEAFHGLPSDELWARGVSRQQEELRHSEWHSNVTQIAAPDRGPKLHANLQHLQINDIPQTPQTSISPGQRWPSNTQHWNQGIHPYQGSNFGRPASVPETMNRPAGSHSPIVLNRQAMDGRERHGQSPSFKIPSSNGMSVPSHLLGPQYQTWGRDVNSEPLLTASTKRSVSECEALLLQHQRHQARLASRSTPQQFRSQKW